MAGGRRFSLTQLLAIGAALGLAGVLLIVGLLGAVRRADRTRCRSHLKLIGMAIATYQQDSWYGAWPEPGAALLRVDGLDLERTRFHCPGAPTPHERGDYLRQAGWGHSPVRPERVVAGDAAPRAHHAGESNLLYEDAHVGAFRPDDPPADNPYVDGPAEDDVWLSRRILE